MMTRQAIRNVIEDMLGDLDTLEEQQPEMAEFCANVRSMVRLGFVVADLSGTDERGVPLLTQIVGSTTDMLCAKFRAQRTYSPGWDKDPTNPLHAGVLKDLVLAFGGLHRTLMDAAVEETRRAA